MKLKVSDKIKEQLIKSYVEWLDSVRGIDLDNVWIHLVEEREVEMKLEKDKMWEIINEFYNMVIEVE